MRTPAGSPRKTIVDETYFERKTRELVVPEDEIEAWELDARTSTRSAIRATSSTHRASNSGAGTGAAPAGETATNAPPGV